MKSRSLRFHCLAVLAAISALGARAAGPGTAPPPIVIQISIDACRWDYLQRFHPPALSDLAAHGVTAERMLSCFPSSTFPNHYTIVTGLRPEHHGIVANDFYDPAFKAAFSLGNGAPAQGRWWGGEPVWVTAGKQGLRSACMFWPGSEAEIAGHRPDLWRPYAWKTTCAERTAQVLDWLRLPAAERPRYLTLYFDVVDSAGHEFGPATPEVQKALADVDNAIGQLVAGVRQLGLAGAVDYVITSDHGMASISRQRRIVIDDYVDPATIDLDYKGSFALLRPHDGDAAALVARFAHAPASLHAYRREDVPAALHYRDNPRIDPVILIADSGWMIGTRASFAKDDKAGRGNGGAHGYDPAVPDMGATFIAAGPAFKSGVVLPPFENIHVYDLVCAVLGLHPAPNDGDNRLAWQALKP
jgi:predicted AlkP superfamily pyrophosphatase or phosphodiesterase